MTKHITILFFVLSILSCKSQPSSNIATQQNKQTLLWEISGNGLAKPSYVYGTFHLLCKKDILVSPSLQTAVANVDEVYMELDMDDPAIMFGGIKLMNMKDGKKLKDLYTPAEYNKLTAYFKDSMQIPINMFGSMKPFFLMSMLYPKMTDCNASSGVEAAVMKVAKTNKKETKGLETMEFQASVFDSIPYSTQASELLKMIDSLPKYKKYMDTLIGIYLSQDLHKIEEQFSKDEMGMMDNQSILLDDRNIVWVKKLNKLLPQKSLFIAVGAGHLVGEKGLLQLLAKNGYTIRPLVNQ
jgi:uncharacterized protein